MVKNETCLETLEELRDDIDLYLSMDGSMKVGSVLTACRGSKYVESTLDYILIKEELLNRIMSRVKL